MRKSDQTSQADIVVPTAPLGDLDGMHCLAAPLDALDPKARAVLNEEVGELRRLSALTGQGNTERTVKSSYASMSQRSRSRRPSPTNKTR